MHLLRATLLTLALVVLLAACGASSNSVTVAMEDMRFRQEEVQVKAG
jgi:uncharacterized protein (DUF2141 family)